MANLLQITPEQWHQANEFFRLHPAETKMEKPRPRPGPGMPRTDYSFVKVEGKIYAISNGTYLGDGSFNRVKVAQDENGKNYKASIRSKNVILNKELKEKIERFDRNEKNALIELQLYFGQATRDFGKEQRWFRKNIQVPYAPVKTSQKIYQIAECSEGDSLFDLLNGTGEYHGDLLLTEIQKILIAIQCCIALDRLYQNHRMLHRDIKPDNIIIKIQGNEITATLIDFGFAIQLPVGETKHIDQQPGTDGFLAPELFRNEASHQTDIYALGKTFHDLGIAEKFVAQMIENNPEKRTPLKELIQQLFLELENIPAAQENLQAQTVAAAYLQQLQEEAAALAAKQPPKDEHWIVRQRRAAAQGMMIPPAPPQPLAQKVPAAPVAQPHDQIAVAGGYHNNCGLHCVIHTLFSLPEAQIRALANTHQIFDELFMALHQYYNLPGNYNREAILALNHEFNHPYDREILWGQPFRSTLRKQQIVNGKVFEKRRAEDGKFLDDELIGGLTKIMGAKLVAHNQTGNPDIPAKMTYVPADAAPTWDLTIYGTGAHFNFSFDNKALNTQHNAAYAQRHHQAKLYRAAHLPSRDGQRQAIEQIVQRTYRPCQQPIVAVMPAVPAAPPIFTPLADAQAKKVDATEPKKVHWAVAMLATARAAAAK